MYKELLKQWKKEHLAKSSLLEMGVSGVLALKDFADWLDKRGHAQENTTTLEEELRELIITWRSYANGDYCQTYNIGMAQGLHCAATNLGNSLDYHAAQQIAQRPAGTLQQPTPDNQSTIDRQTEVNSRRR